MQEYNLNNKETLLYIKPKYNIFILISIVLFITSIFLSFYFYTYDSYRTTGVFYNNEIILNIPVTDLSKVVDSDFLKLNNKSTKFSISSVSPIQYDENTLMLYQRISLKTAKSFKDNISVKLTFYKNKQRIITKAINLLK